MPSVTPTVTVPAAVLFPPVVNTVHVPVVALSESRSEIVQAPSAPPSVLSPRPRRDTECAGAIPGYDRNLSGVNFTHIARDPYDDLYGCNKHYAKASSLHGAAKTDADALKEVINIFGVFKTVCQVHADSLSAATLRGVLPSCFIKLRH
jgi:hypothetical protein